MTRYGTPSELRSDRGSDLIAGLSTQFYELCGVKMVTSTSHHHKGVPSQTERIQSTLLGLARATYGGYPGEWIDMLPFLLFSIRATPSREAHRMAQLGECVLGRSRITSVHRTLTLTLV